MASSLQTSSSDRSRFAFLVRWMPALLGMLAFLAVVAFVDVADDVSWSGDGPGLTTDEGINVEGGVFIVESVFTVGLAAVHPLTVFEIFNSPEYFPDYPPLGRVPLGLTNALLMRVLGPEERGYYVLTYARVASALQFGLLVWLIAAFCRRQFGNAAAFAGGISLILMPRVFGHAHIASVETMMNLTYSLCVLGTASSLADRPSLTWRDGLWPGFLLGLALLTKMQAIFLPPVLVVWYVMHWRWQGLRAVTVVAAVSAATFLLFWPWLWADPFGRSLQYFAQSTDRAQLYCYYLGERFADRDVPWHYPWVMFLVTTPLVSLLLGIFGGVSLIVGPLRRLKTTDHAGWNSARFRIGTLLFGAWLLPLLAFSLPGTTVYDGARLFLVVWPVFAVWIGAGVQCLWDCTARDMPASSAKGVAPKTQQSSMPWPRIVATLVVAVGAGFPLWSSVQLHPLQLSYYSEVIGGLAGAEKLGMERTYWGDSLTPAFLRETSPQLPDGARVAVTPVMHHLVLDFMRQNSWLRHRPDLELVPFTDEMNESLEQGNAADLDVAAILVEMRLAELRTSLQDSAMSDPPTAAVERDGVTLSKLLLLP